MIAYAPSITATTYEPRGTLIDDTLGNQYTALSFSTIADGGFDSASITLTGDLPDMETWFDAGLNRHIEIYNPALELIWAGFVNQVRLSAGTLTATRGPLMEICNRCSVTYTPILDATTDPPTTGTQTVTTIADDDDSITKYGVLEQVVSGGQLLDDDPEDTAPDNRAETLRDTYLDEMKDPQSSEELGLGSSSQPSVTLSLLGYRHRFSGYMIQDETTSTIQISNDDGTGKMQLVIAAQPNALFSTDFTQMEGNALLTSQYEDGTRDAWTILTELNEMGDASNVRTTLGVYDDQRVTYAALPTGTAYEHKIAEVTMRVTEYGSGVEVRPWDVRPAKWLLLSDFLTGLTETTGDKRKDPRYIFVESVTFTAPYNVQINGGKISTIKQMLAKQGMW